MRSCCCNYWLYKAVFAVALFNIVRILVLSPRNLLAVERIEKTANVEVQTRIASTKEQHQQQPQQQQQRLIMYLGPIKTASTTLQRLLFEHNATLQEDDVYSLQHNTTFLSSVAVSVVCVARGPVRLLSCVGLAQP